MNKEEISTFATSTHTGSIAMIMEYIHNVSHAEIFVIGINIVKADFSPTISKKVKESADSLIGFIKDAVC